YRFENLPVGTYTITVNAAGFAKSEVQNVSVELNQTVTTNVTLAVGKSTTSVEVSTAAVAIDTTTAQVQSTFETKQITDLPVTATGSGVLNLALLAPGVGTSGTVGAGTGPSVGGQRPRNNNFTIEGIDNNSGSVTGPLVSLPNDSVAEFSSLQNQYSPDFGHSSGGQFNTIVKSGTNQFHGMLYEYFQNRDLNAADNLAAVSGTPLHPRYDNNRFGGNVGGPIKHNKLFFFVDYEYNPVGAAGTPGQLFAPTQAGLATITATPGINQNNFNTFKKYVPVASSSCAGSANCPSVPLGSLAIGALYNFNGTPPGSIDVGQIPVTSPSYTNNEAGVASIDYNISDRDSLRGRFVLNRTGSIDTAANLPVFFQTVPTNAYLVTFSEYHNFTPTVINELRGGYNRSSNITPAGNFSFPGLDQFPNLVYNDLSLQVGPDGNAPQYGYQNVYQLTDNLTWTKGAHSFKVGFDGERNVSPQSFTQRARGDYEYSYLSDYLFDYTPDLLGERSAGNPVYWGNRWLFGWYANDVWKLKPNLTINLGLRYEYETVPASENNQTLNAIASVPGLITFGAPQPQTDNIMPRVGIAYSPGTSGKTSIRAGFGINYDVLYDNLGLLTLPPELSTTQDAIGNGASNFLANGGLPPTGPAANFTAAEARKKTAGFVPNVLRPKSYQWNIGIQHEFAGNYIFETRYLGTRGTDLDIQDQLDKQPIVNASNALPVYWSMPSQATLNSLTSTQAALLANYPTPGAIVPAYYNAGFRSNITSYQPYGNSVYHGWANQLTRRFNNGLQFIGSYTWSHAIDDSTADVFSTVTTPRRPEDSQDLRQDRSSSALDHRQRFSFEMVYDVPFFKHSNWFMKNILGNWELAPIYTYQTGTFWTVESGVDSNLNGDSWPDRAFVNPNGGNPAIGSGVTALTNTNGDVVAFLVNNPAAAYAQGPKGTLPNGGRNTRKFNPIDDVDVTAAKRFNFTERSSLEFSARLFNVLNHPQYVGGSINDVAPVAATSESQREFLEPQNQFFGQLSQVWSSNPRSMVLALKFIF
ncbi:MAG: TonB-dependent receptor, partial [Acidobacteriaceae bacterium]|nr:TonB-dependent receptor [Acidobacteriaceae bacterium]MBV9295590.1 TonB-dependent receptor [Acidobacteriaceae bacterium]